MSGLLAGVLVALVSQPATQPAPQRFLIAIGTNAVPTVWEDRGLAPLRYADDDALAFAQLGRELGWRTTLLTVADQSSQVQHPQLVPTARPPTVSTLRKVLAEHQRAFAELEREGRGAELIIAFSGHGRASPPQLALLDGVISQRMLYEEILAGLPARFVHLLVDACHAEAMVSSKGPSAELQADVVSVEPEDVRSWFERFSLERFPQVGAIVATSKDAQAHEWDALGHGIFTHEIISGLRGAADVNGDRRVEYSELEAFVSSANREIQVPKAKLSVVTRTPKLNLRAPIIDLSATGGSAAWLIEGSAELGRFFVEDHRGVRIADAHAEPSYEVSILVPADVPLTVVSANREAQLKLRPGQKLSLKQLRFAPRSATPKDAVASALGRGLFRARFGPHYYRGFVDRRAGVSVVWERPIAPAPARIWPAWTAWGLAAGLLVSSAVLGPLALDARADWNATQLQGPAMQARLRYDRARIGFFVTAGSAVALGALGAWLFPWGD